MEVEELYALVDEKKGLAVRFFFTDGTNDVIRLPTTNPKENYVPVLFNKPITRIEITSGYVNTKRLYEFDLKLKRDKIPPGKPTGLSALPGFDEIKLSWNQNPENDMFGYNIYVDGKKINSMPITRDMYTLKAQDYAKVYTIYITAVDLSGNESVPSDQVQGTPIQPPDTTPPGRPLGLQATPEVGQIKLDWTANTEPDLDGYLVFQDNVQLFQTPIKTNSFVVSGGLSYTTDTEFYVVAVDTSGNMSMKSNVVKARPIKPPNTTPPPVPSNLRAAMSADQLSIETNWGASVDPDLEGYYVYVSTDGTNFTRHNSAPIPATNYDITNLQADTVYHIRVTAVNIYGLESGPSNTVRIKSPSRNTTVTPGKPQADYWDISWTPVPGAVSYAIYYNNQKVGEVPGNVTTFRITKAMGYNPNGAIQVVDVRAQFSNGSSGGSNQPGRPVGSGWGMAPKDIITNSMFIIASLSSLVLLGLVIGIAPRLIKMLKKSIDARRRAT